MSLLFVLLVLFVDLTNGFVVTPSSRRVRIHDVLLSLSSSKNNDHGQKHQQQPQQQPLRSSYPDGTPAILKGEAVRSALTSGRCLAWSFNDSSSGSPFSNGGLLRIHGKGTIDFLNNKLTQTFGRDGGHSEYKEACLLDPKGRLVDNLRVASTGDSSAAYIMTSPGYSSQTLLERLDPYIFPLDQVELTNMNQAYSFTVASTNVADVQKAMNGQIITNARFQSSFNKNHDDYEFPSNDQYQLWTLQDDQTNTNVLVVPSTGLPSIGCVGYTFVFFSSESNDDNNGDDADAAADATLMGQQVFQYLISEQNSEGPIEVGEAEYESLRIECGQPAYGYEYCIVNKKLGKKKSDEQPQVEEIKTNPLELFLGTGEYIDSEKGCYLGQEGIASVVKNPRGPPRSLYQVVFEDEYNNFDDDPYGYDDEDDNLTTYPKAGKPLYALGSSEQIPVGKITSIESESGGTGKNQIMGLALIRRADSILSKLNEYDIEIPRGPMDDLIDITESSGMVQPPPLDPLEGLEVIIGGTYTVGKLQVVPYRRQQAGGMPASTITNMFDEDVVVVDMPEISITTTPQPIPDSDNETTNAVEASISETKEHTIKASAAVEPEDEAKEAEEEAKRKAEKMKMLRKRAEEAIQARRKKKKTK